MSTLDVSDFERALRFVATATGKEEAPLVNKYSLQTIIGSKGIEGAMQRTPKADRSKIQNVPDAQIRAGIVARLRRAGKLKTTTTEQLNAYVALERDRRQKAKGYTAYVGWTKAAQDFGGTGAVGSGKPPADARRFPESEARKGKGQKATPGILTATFENSAPMAEAIGEQPLQDSLDAQVPDMIEYGTKKLQGIFDQVGAR